MALGMILENGWPECDLSDTTRLTIPGTALSLPIRSGFPHVIMQAFFRDMDAYIEPCMNARGISDEGSWTEDNSVYTSNHKGATAVDWNWADHPMGQADAGWNGSVYISGSQVPAVRELLAFYTFEGLQLIWWGNDWNSPKDSMHFQMGYGTNTAAGIDKMTRFIAKFIRADGYSTYRRGDTNTPAITGGLTPAVLARVMDNRVSMARYEQLYPRFMEALELANINTLVRRRQFAGQLGTESGGLKYQREIASGAQYEGRIDLGNTQPGDGVRFAGRDFIQITGRYNYTQLSAWAFSTGRVPTRTFFVDNPDALATDEYAFVGVVWFWTQYRNMNALADTDDIVAVTKAVNGGTTNLADRMKFYARAVAVGNDLLNPITTDEWETLMADTTKEQSRSIYRTDNNKIFTARDMLFNADATTHAQLVETSALRGEAWAIDAVSKLAAGNSAGAQTWWDASVPDTWAVQHAQAVLQQIEQVNGPALKAYIDGKAS